MVAEKRGICCYFFTGSVVEMFLEYFGMEDELSHPTKNQPPTFVTTDERKEWLFKTVQSMLDEYLFPYTRPAVAHEEELIGKY